MNKVKYAKVYNYARTGKLKDDGTASIYIRAYLQGKNKFFPTGISVAPKQWDSKNRKIINHPLQVKYNQLIREMETKLEDFELMVSLKEGSISLERLADFDNDTIDISFTDFYLKQLENQALKISNQSFTDHRQTFQKLCAFREPIFFSEVNYKLVSRFDSFLFGLGLHTNTVAKHHKNLKTYINQAIEFDYLDVNQNPYKRFKVKSEPTERIFLTSKELKVLEEMQIVDNTRAMIRDFFLFCSWTGLRFGDASILLGTDFRDEDNGFILSFIAEKTKKPHRLNLSKLFDGKPERLIKKYLDKYDDFYFDDPDKPMPVFFKLTNQFINRELKEIVKPLDVREAVKEKISCHVARHTFGTIMAGKVKLHILQRLMQHSKIKETMIYIHLNNQLMDDELDQVQW